MLLRARRPVVVLSVLATAAAVLSFPIPPPALPLMIAVLALCAMVVSGLALGRSSGLGAPLLEPDVADRTALVRSALIAGAVAGLTLGSATLVFLRFSPAREFARRSFLGEASRPAWQRWVVALDAAVIEEVLFRLFLVSVLVWLMGRLRPVASRSDVSQRASAAIVIAAAVFGLAHLPKWLGAAAGYPALLAGVVIVNGLGGLTFGVVFRRRGIESAIVAHFAADAVLHVLGPTLTWT